MSKYDASLVAKVKAVNDAHTYAPTLHAMLTEAIAPFVGQQIFKADGGFMAKVAKVLPKLPCTPALHCYLSSSRYLLSWVVKTCESYEYAAGRTGCLYYETTVYVGKLDNNVLTALEPFTERRTDYTAAEITEKRKKAADLKTAYENARSDIYPFSECRDD